MNMQALPYILITGLAFGSSLISSRFGIRQINPYVFTGLRLAMASLAFLTIYWLNRRHRPWPSELRLWRYACILGIFGLAIPMTATLLALQYISSGIAAILITTGPALTVLLAHFFLADERLTRRKTAGVILALSGALLLTVRGESGLPNAGQSSFIGYLMILSVLLFGSGTTIYTRKFLQGYDAFDVTSLQVFVATLVVFPMSILLIGFDLHQVEGSGYVALIYSALAGTFLGFLGYFYLIKQFGATSAAMTNYLIPVSASLGGVLLLGETITPGMVIGMAIIIAGIVIINYRRRTARLPSF
jgi:drug/metabolite transporter (DMT)-like permease